jgi:RNA-directed DNA polymerase
MPPLKAGTGCGDHRGGDPRNGKPAIQWWRPWAIEGKASEEETTAERPCEAEGRMDRVVQRDHRLRARKHVHSHGGSAGMEGMTVEALAPSLKEHGPRGKQALRAGPSQPQPGTRVEGPKPQGGSRKLGVPTGGDRFLQQAVRQGLQAQGDPPCSGSSFGCRPGRHAHQAGKRAPSYLKAGYPGVGDRDREKVFDRGNHAKVMREVSTRGRDRRVWTLIHRFLTAGAREQEARQETVDGVAQGGPLAPRRSNRIRDRLDRELERWGPQFVRYADARNGSVRSKRAGSRG